MVAGQPSSQPVVGDDTGTLADTGSQQPPMKHHRSSFRSQPGGKHCIYADTSPPSPSCPGVCVGEKF